jgi:hypothetical protein
VSRDCSALKMPMSRADFRALAIPMLPRARRRLMGRHRADGSVVKLAA